MGRESIKEIEISPTKQLSHHYLPRQLNRRETLWFLTGLDSEAQSKVIGALLHYCETNEKGKKIQTTLEEINAEFLFQNNSLFRVFFYQFGWNFCY